MAARDYRRAGTFFYWMQLREAYRNRTAVPISNRKVSRSRRRSGETEALIVVRLL
jgi:hypothetical protein